MIHLRRMPVLLLAAGIAVLASTGCSRLSKGGFSGLTVVAPDYLKGVIETVTNEFEKENNTRVQVIYEPFDQVLDRAGHNGVDLFVIGDPDQPEIRETLDSLLKDGDFLRPFRLSLVLAGRPDGPICDNIKDLAGDDFHRVVVLDTAQYEGWLAQEALQRAGVWKKIRDKLILARSISQMVSYLKSGETDAVAALEVSLRDEKGWIPLARLDDDRRIQRRLLHSVGMVRATADTSTARALLDLFDLRECPLYRVKGVLRNSEE
jgi:molybdate transport system substrate-binding protein